MKSLMIMTFAIFPIIQQIGILRFTPPRKARYYRVFTRKIGFEKWKKEREKRVTGSVNGRKSRKTELDC
jgi:hypothetical protein